jgi:ABC-type antimicrobial peptide transport system permease subunit
MLTNYIIIAWRTLWKNKAFTAINIAGLTIGISISLVIYLIVNYHLNYNKLGKDRIYRVVSDFVFSGEEYHNSGVTVPLATAINKDLSGIDEVAPFYVWNNNTKVSIPYDSLTFKKQGRIIFADAHYFNLFNHQWLAGNPATSLQQPYQTVLTVSSAKLYFPKLTVAEIIGREIYFNDSIRTTVTGIVKDFKENTDFTFKVFISHITLATTSLKPEEWDQWSSTNSASQLFIKLSGGDVIPHIEKEINKLYNRNHTPDADDNSKTSYSLQPLSDIHFNQNYGAFRTPLADKQTLYGLLTIAAFLLLLGCINFINLMTAQASQRIKEIGIRKAVGSSKNQLIRQFLTETFLLTFIATLFSVLLTPAILMAFSKFIPEGLHFNLIAAPGVIAFLIILMLVVTLLSGFYPALVLSGYNPIYALKNQTGKTRSIYLRKTLTISQFVIAQVFVIATIIVNKQINYSLNKDLGFKKNAIVYFSTPDNNKRLLLAEKLKTIPEIDMVSLSSTPPSSSSTWSSTIKYKETETDVQIKIGDSNYLKLYQLRLLAGENIRSTDTVTGVIINQRYMHTMGLSTPQEAIGKYIDWDNERLVPITGVVADFHQTSLREHVKPLIIASWSDKAHTVNISLHPLNKAGTSWESAIKKMENVWKEVYPQEDFSYSFFDEEIAKLYQNERQVSQLLLWATGLAIFISCLGLLGLVIYTIGQRTKEIGIRKVLGASVMQIVALISKDFILLIIFALIIATPIAWIGMHKWLEQFAYRTDINYWVFILSGLIMIVIALLTLGVQTIKAAMLNPVKSLKVQ